MLRRFSLWLSKDAYLGNPNGLHATGRHFMVDPEASWAQGALQGSELVVGPREYVLIRLRDGSTCAVSWAAVESLSWW